jgi:hypothetical protein
MNRCTKLLELPSVVTEWEQTTWCPDCDYYDSGTCGHPNCSDGNVSCPFDDKALPLREVGVEPTSDTPKPREAASVKGPETQKPSRWLEEAVRRRILDRTGRRMRSLKVELTGCQLVITGQSPSYYIKQLALEAAHEVIRSVYRIELHIKAQVEVAPAMATETLSSVP